MVQGNSDRVVLNSNGDKVTVFFDEPEINIRNASMYFELESLLSSSVEYCMILIA